MKKMILLVALITVIAFVSGVMAQQKPAEKAAAPAVAKPAATAPAPAEKPKAVKTKKKTAPEGETLFDQKQEPAPEA